MALSGESRRTSLSATLVSGMAHSWRATAQSPLTHVSALLVTVPADKMEIRLYLEAMKLADLFRSAANEIAPLDLSDHSKVREVLLKPLARIEEARAACSEPAARQLASLLVLGSRHKSVRCKNVSHGSECRFGAQCCFMHGDHDRFVITDFSAHLEVCCCWPLPNIHRE